MDHECNGISIVRSLQSLANNGFSDNTTWK